MAKKSKRGEKLDLQEFLGAHAKALPSAPSIRDPNAPEPERRERYRRDAPLGGFEEPASGSGWRRGAGPEGDSFDQGPRRPREELPPSMADEDTEWRKSRPPRGGDDDFRGSRRPPSAADDASEWRRREPMGGPTDGPSEWRRPQQPSFADEASEWRRKQPITPADEPSSHTPRVSLADEASEWRRKDPIRLEPPTTTATPAVALSDSDPQWRKHQPVRPVVEENSSPAPRPSESDDWRANKPPAVERLERPKSSNSAASRDSDNWRAAAKLKKISGVSQQQGQNSGKRKQRETIPVNTEVLTPFGNGVFLEERANDRMRVVKLSFGATAYLRPEDVIPSFPEELQTSYGKAKFISYRFSDSMCEVELEFGGHAYIRLSEILSANNVKTGKSGRPESFGNKRSNAGSAKDAPLTKDAPPRAGNRRYGDQERDKERENAFAKGEKGEETPTGPSKADQFAAFSSTSRSRAPEGEREEGGNRAPRSELFAAFSRDKKTDEPRGISGPPKVSREEKDKYFSAFNSGPRSRGDREGEPPRALAQGPPRGDLFAAFDRNRDSNPRPPRGEEQSRVPFPSFGRNRDLQGPPRVGSANSNESGSYHGGMERLAASRPPRVGDFGTDAVPRVGTASPAQDEFPSLPGSRASEPSAPVIPKALPKGTKWGDEDDVEAVPITKSATPAAKDKATPPPKKVTTMEIALVGLRKAVKEYMIGEDRAGAVASFGALAVEDENELQATIVSSLANEAFAGTKLKKLVSALYNDLVAKNIVSVEAVAEGLTRALEASGGDAEKLAVLSDLLKTVEEKNPSLVEVKLREAGSKLRGAGDSSEAGGASNVEVLAKDLYASGSVDKLKETGFAKLPGAGLALLDIVLKDAKLDDPACAWVTKNAKILGAVLYDAPIKEQLKALEAIQVAFNGINFPKSTSGSIFEKVFTQLYNLDVFPDTAFIEWKDDLSLNAPGRDKAIIQTTNFFVNLEAEEYDDEEEDE